MMKTCSYCGIQFIPVVNHMYRRKKDGKSKMQCSYSCYRKEGGDTGTYNRRYNRKVNKE